MTDTAQRCILGTAMVDQELFKHALADLDVKYFDKHHFLAGIILRLANDGEPTDVTAIRSEVERSPYHDKFRVHKLLEYEDHAAFSREGLILQVEALKESYLKSQLKRIGQELSASLPSDVLLSNLEQEIQALHRENAGEAVHVRDVIKKVLNEIDQPIRKGIRTGLAPLDNLTGGFKPGELIVLAARPSMGKTALATMTARQAAESGKEVVIFSLEMTKEQIVQRMLAEAAKVTLGRVANHRLYKDEMRAVVEAAEKLFRANLHIVDDSTRLSGICWQIKRKTGRLGLVVIDYLQLLDGNSGSREQDVAAISRRCKRLARELSAPVLLLSQLNREVEKRQCKRPQLSDLRESGAIEQDADIVMLLWREGYYTGDENDRSAELVVAKHRNGATGIVELEWIGHCARFETKGLP